jgi:putative membrane-bound dehydrogenase-like protein
MHRLAVASVVIACILTAVPAADKPVISRHEVQLNGHTFTLPEGFDIELAAGPPLVDRPITADFDELGRLYVADSSGSSEDVNIQLQKKPHRILRLEDSRGNGRFDKSTVFADRMMFPEGTMWHQGSLYVAAPPSIWKLTDTRGTGTADQRVEWFQGKTLTRCANDLHGPYLGPDGWIYWCKGAFAEQKYERPGKPPFVTRAAHIFRCRPDGSRLEPVMTGGMDNPVDVAFTPGGERIFTTTFLQFPGGGRRDGLIHAIYGGVYGKDHDVIFDHRRTSPVLMPVLTHLGPAAPCGLTRYESAAFGPEYTDNLFACLFNMQKVTRHVLRPSGSGFATIDEDFLVSSNRDFHPTDVIEDADGSLLVIDTGGWYKLCCPTSQLGKPDVLGAIYRIRRKGAPRVEDPRGLKLAWDKLEVKELSDLLDDPRPAVRRRAVETLASKGKEAVPALIEVLRHGRSERARSNAVWTATRIDLPEARSAVRAALDDANETVRQAALNSTSLWRDRDAVPALRKLLQGSSLANRRVAAEALGRSGDKSAVPALFAALEELAQASGSGEPDRALEHALIFALIEIGDRQATADGLSSKVMRVRRAALIALDQMDETSGGTTGKLEAATVAKELDSAETVLKETAWWIVSRHPEWGEALAGVLRAQLGKKLTTTEQDDLVGLMARFVRAPAIQDLLADRLRDSAKSPTARRIALRAMAQSGLRQLPEPWLAGITEVISSGPDDVVLDAVTTARLLPIQKEKAGKLTTQLFRLAEDPQKQAELRLAALAAVPGGLTQVSESAFAFLKSRLDAGLPVGTRTLAADVLARSKLTQDQLLALTALFEAIGPMEAERLVEAFTQSNDDKVGKALVDRLRTAPVRSGLRVDTLKRALAKYGPAVQQPAAELYASLNEDAGKQKEKLDRLLASLKDGDVRRGQAVFNSTRAACVSCHAIGYIGGQIGPDLTRIGQVRGDRDLLESIVFPSASFVQGYQPVRVTTKSGKEVNGLMKKETPEEMVLTINATEEVRIRRDNIEDIQPSKVSIMPAGLDQQLTPQELADLVAFLRACK